MCVCLCDYWESNSLHKPLETRTLATANRSRVSNRVIKNFGQGRGHGGPWKKFSANFHTKFGSCFSYYVRTCKRSPKVLGCWSRAPWDAYPLEIRSSPRGTIAKSGHSRSNDTIIITEIRQKNFTPRILSFTVTQGHWNWHGSIGDLWLPITDPQ